MATTAVKKFISGVENKTRCNDALALLTLMEEASGYKAALNGSIIYFGRYHYIYESGREGDAGVTAFSPRKQNLVVYIMPGFSRYQDLMKKLGKVKTGSSCLYINKLEDIDLAVLKNLVKTSVKDMQKRYACKAT
ncbi:MAG: DUF1801 domain-containing protein [Gammaproteobacteria bacterium]|nr:DUF1801 domain-containing protein [Gammaproteobacteria bacterium]